MLEINNLVLDSVEFWGEHEGNKGGMRISWSANIGFGQLDIFQSKESDGIIAFTECMANEDDKSFIGVVFGELIKKLHVLE